MKSRTYILEFFIKSRVYSRLPASEYEKLINYETCCATTMKISACEIFYFENLFPVSYRRKEHSIGIDLSCQVVCTTLDGVHCYQFINILCARPQRLRKAILARMACFKRYIFHYLL